jgi:hypothetical protein
MKIIPTFVFTLIALTVLSSCEQTARVHDTQSPDPSATSKEDVSSETAILIARGFLCFDFDLRNRNVFVTDLSDSWQVQFVRTKDLDIEGGDPFLIIRKDSGEIVSGNVAK